ncbi:MAG: PGAP1-like protein-domain-containing protein [Linnemannia gamsii]|nr:MAG: PGAP1-like protein-domain-containing protein [Linnemannia gamsii]
MSESSTPLSGITHPADPSLPPPPQQSTEKDDLNASSSSSSLSPSHLQQRHVGAYTTNIPKTPYTTPTYGCSTWLASLVLFSAIILGCVTHSSFNHQLDPKGCVMTYMQPTYYRILGMDETISPRFRKYNLLLYRDDEYDDHIGLNRLGSKGLLTQLGSSEWAVDTSVKIQPTGVPALFIPGNSGSAKQVRSIAKEAAKYYYQTLIRDQGDRPAGSKAIDFFTLDLNEEFSAFHGQLFQDQAHFANEVIAYILSLYDDVNDGDSSSPRPTSVMIIGHSMGGVIARSIFTTDNYIQGSVNAILTVASPHMIPPIALDDEISAAYDRIEDFWTHGFQTSHSPLANVSLVSIMGGNLDITVNSDSGNIHHLVPQSHGFSVFTSSIPHAWVGTDHLSIMWCNQVAMAIGKALVDSVDARRAEQVKPLGERMKVFRRRFLTGAEEFGAHDEQELSLSEFEHTFVGMDTTWAFPPTTYNAQMTTPHLFIVTLPGSLPQSTITLLTDHAIGQNSRLDIFLCRDHTLSTPSSLNPQTLSCRSDKLTFAPIPASTESSTMPLFTGEYYTAREFRFTQKQVKDMTGHPYLVVLDRGRQYAEPGFLLAEFSKEGSHREVIETTTITLLRAGLRRSKFPQRPALMSMISLPNMDSSLLAYNLKVARVGCQGQRFAPMIRQSSWAMHEDKYSVNIAGKASGIDINFHGDLPYFDKIQLGGNNGVELRFWMDPTCPEPLSLALEVDKYGSLGKVVIRYRMVVLVFTFLVILLTLRAQIRGWTRTGHFMSFGETLSKLVRSTFWKFSVLLAVISMLQHLFPRTAVDIGSEAISSSQGSSLAGSKLKTANGSLWWQHSGQWFGDALLGDNDAFFWFLAPVFFQMAVGIVAFVWIMLNTIVRTLAILTRRCAGSDFSSATSTMHRVVSLAVVCVLVFLVIPYHFAFTATLLWLIWSSARILSHAQRQQDRTSQTTMAWNRFHFVMSFLVTFFFLLPFCVPVLMVWIRNFAIGWFKSFAGDHRVDYVLPFLVFVEGLSHGSSVDTESWKRFSGVTVLMLEGMVGYLVVFGVRYSWQIYSLTRLWIVWLLVLRVVDSSLVGVLKRKALRPEQCHSKQD